MPSPITRTRWSRFSRGGLGDRQGRGQGLGEHRDFIGHRRGHRVQVFLGQGEVLGKGAVMPQQAQNPALLAVAGEAPAAAGAGSGRGY